MYFAWFIQDRGYVQYLFVLLTTKYHRTTRPRIPGEVDTEERGYIYMQITMEAVFAVLLAGMGGFIVIPELCESSVGIVELFPNRIQQCP